MPELILDRAINFYAGSPDGQYDDYVERILRILRTYRNSVGDEARAAALGELQVMLDIPMPPF